MISATREFKGEKLRTWIEAQIRTGIVKPGMPILSEHQLSRRFKISRATVRKVIDEFVEEGMLVKQKGSGTFLSEDAEVAARLGAHDGARTILLVLVTGGHLYDDILRQVIQNVQSAGFRQSIVGTISDPGSRPQFQQPIDALLDELSEPPLAVVCEQVWPCHLDALEPFEARGVPIVWLAADALPFGSRGHLVTCDYESGIYEATRHLARIGHDRIVFITHGTGGGYEWESSVWHMRKGFRRAVRDAGIAAACGVVETAHPIDAPAVLQAEFETLLAAPDRPTAIVAEQDYKAAILLKAAESLGLRVPEDLAVVGCFNTPWAEMLGLTSVDVRPAELARCLTHVMRFLETTPDLPSLAVRVRPRLVVRGTCGARIDACAAASQ